MLLFQLQRQLLSYTEERERLLCYNSSNITPSYCIAFSLYGLATNNQKTPKIIKPSIASSFPSHDP